MGLFFPVSSLRARSKHPRVNNRFQLPALRSLGELAGTEPVIVIDTREQAPLSFSRLKAQAGTLITGDYSIAGLESLFAVERKSIPDLVGCCIGQNRERFERELHRLRGFRFKRLLIVGTEAEILKGGYRSNIKPAAVLGTLRAFEIRYDTPVVFCDTAEAAAARIESWAYWFARELVQAINNLRRASGFLE
jgi:ERCC4-type nuclease